MGLIGLPIFGVFQRFYMTPSAPVKQSAQSPKWAYFLGVGAWVIFSGCIP